MRFKKIGAALLACAMCFGVFSTTAFAYVDESVATEEPAVEEKVPETEPEEPMLPLTPDGNLTLVDDAGSPTKSGKQFITAVTKNGNYFYIIIDRDDKGEETVHFLNQVDEADLLKLMDEEEVAEFTKPVEETKPEVVETVPEITEPTPEEKPKSTNMLPAILTLIVQIARQLSVEIQPMQTLYKFACGPVNLDLTFTAPLFMDDLELMARPVNYISYTVASTDGQKHAVELYFEASPQWAVDLAGQPSTAESFVDENLVFLKTGSRDQKVLAKKGDDVRIDWGYFYLAADKENTQYATGSSRELRKSFVEGKLSATGTDGYDRLALVRSLGETKVSEGHLLIGYDDIYSVQYFGENLRPYWNRSGNETIVSQFHKAEREYDVLMTKAIAFDNQLMREATEAGGRKYAELCALAYRQAIAAHKLVETPDKELLFLSKENFSNGSIGTVDITYPSAPLFLLYNPEIAKALLNHIFYYSESGKWTKPFAAHDIGTYPLANGQTYNGDMPVEESGNMLIITAVIAAIEGNADYAKKHWETLTTWTNYLVEYGLDPENQLCTDDFAGHFAHNANLSVKAILGIASYGYLADKLGKKEIAGQYTQKAKEMAVEWERMANDGDHYKLTFDKSGTWSQKYNLVWDKLMNWQIFPEQIVKTEIPYYLTKQNRYGLPLDNRQTYTKTDWIMWTATLAPDKATFEEFIEPVYLFMNETTDRIPMSDWVFTDKPEHRAFQARSVVGGYFIKMLENKMNN